jgi:hypothetical protein
VKYRLPVCLCFLAVAVALGVDAWTHERKPLPPDPLSSEFQFADALAGGRDLHFYREPEHAPGDAILVADHPLADVNRLVKGATPSGDWKGVVWVKTVGPEEFTPSPFYRRQGNVILYGDPDLIDELLRRARRPEGR